MPSNTSNSREIRVFLSSTFRDMEAERNYLMTSVFPDIRRYCSERQVSFTEIDLRWGITEEESKQGRTVEICLDEINRCRKYPPFFIGFLGERYGWIPQQQDLAVWLNDNNDSPYASEIHGALAQGISVTELEMQYAFLNEEQPADHSRIFLRAAEKTHHLYQEALAHTSADHPVLESDFYDAANGKLASLKDKLRASKCLSIDGYTSIKEFGDAVKHYLIEAVDHLYPQDTLLSAADMQTRAHNNYAASRRKAYVPLTETRANVLADITTASNGEEAKQAIAITGLSGRGKSAFLADLESQLTNKGWIFSHYTGADGNRSLDSWLSRLIEALTATGTLISEIPSDRDGQWQAISTALLEVQAGLNTPIYLLVDAVNQFTEKDAFNTLSQLKLSESVVLIATTTQAIDDNSWLVHDLPALNPQNRQLAIDSFFSDFRKDLPKELIQKIAQHTAAAEPLFLRLLLEELRLHAKHETLTPLAKQLLDTQDASGLFASVLSAMNDDHQHSTHTELASQAVSLLGASRRGLHHEDLAKLLASDSDPKDPTDNQPRLPDFILSPLLAKLEAFCLRDDGRMYIMHDALLAVALRNSERLTESRLQLVSHFSDNTGHAVAERVHQYTALKDTEKLVQTLGDLDATLALWEYENHLLQLILNQLGADLSDKTQDSIEISKYWANEINNVEELPEKIDEFGNWIQDLVYHNLLEILLQAILKWRIKNLDKEHLDLARSLNNCALLYHFQEKTVEAEQFYLNALEIFEKNSLDSEEIATVMNNLGAIYTEKEDFEKAEFYLLKALKFRQQNLLENDPDTASTHDNLGLLYQSAGDFKQAEAHHLQAINIYKLANYPDIAQSFNNLALVYHRTDKLINAKQFYLLSLKIKKANRFHPSIAITLSNLADVASKLEDLKNAEEYCLEALEICKKTSKPNDKITIVILRILSGVYLKNNNLDEAVKTYSYELDIYLKYNNDKYEEIVRILNNIGTISFNENKFVDAELFFKESLYICQRAGSETNEPLILCLNLLALSFLKQFKFDESIEAYKELIKVYDSMLPKNINGIKETINNIENAKEAKQIMVTNSVRNEIKATLKTANVLNKLAIFYFKVGYLEKAQELFEKILDINLKKLFLDNPNIIKSLKNLALVHEAQNNSETSQSLYIQIDKIKKIITESE